MKYGKFEYPVHSTYVSTWTVLHAMRELIANAMDAEIQHRARKEILYLPDQKKVRIINHCVTLDRTALLFGGSSKEGHAQLIGQFGEGLKLAMLVLVRSGLKMKIRNGRDEAWVPDIAYSEKWGAETLVVEVKQAKRQLETFEVVIDGLEPETWREVQDLFLFMRPATTIELDNGQILTSPNHKGKLYVRGVYVNFDPNYQFGYNFKDLSIGRDREIPQHYQLQYEVTVLHRGYLKKKPDHIEKVYEILGSDAGEATAFQGYDFDDLNESLANHFVELHGKDAVPCATTGETQELKHLGVKGVLVSSRGLADKLQRRLKSPAQVKASLRFKVTKTFGTLELDLDEHATLQSALRLLIQATEIKDAMSRVSVVIFNGAGILGTHEGLDIRISRSVLQNFGKTLAVLIHEFAHDFGLDGSSEHIAAMHEMTEAVFNHMHKERWREHRAATLRVQAGNGENHDGRGTREGDPRTIDI